MFDVEYVITEKRDLPSSIRKFSAACFPLWLTWVYFCLSLPWRSEDDTASCIPREDLLPAAELLQ